MKSVIDDSLEKDLLFYISTFLAEKGYPPTQVETTAYLRIDKRRILRAFDKLVKKGYIEVPGKTWRSLNVFWDKVDEVGIEIDIPVKTIQMVANVVTNFLRITLVGQVGANSPLPPFSAFSNFNTQIDIAQSLITVNEVDDLFAFEVLDNTMIDAMVMKSDIVVLRKVGDNSEVKKNELVAIWLPERNETTLKFIVIRKGSYLLKSVNPTMPPITIKARESLEIKGKVVLIIRNFNPFAD